MEQFLQANIFLVMDKSPSPNFISRKICPLFIKNFLDMADPYGNSPSKYHLIFIQKPSQSGNIEVLSSISYIWEDDRIEKLKNNQWKCLWCNVKFQGINATKALSHVIGTKYMHIKRCTYSVYQAYLSRYKELKQLKSSKKVLLNDYSQKT